MKKFIRDILFFLLFLVPSYFIIIVLWKQHAPKELSKNIPYYNRSAGFTFSRMQEVKRVSEIDVLILGSSHAYRNFDTRYFTPLNISAFNLGSSSQTHVQTHMLLKRYLKALQPRLVLYEVYPFTLTSDGVEASLDLVANDKNDWHSLMMAIGTRNTKVINSLLFAVYNEHFTPQKKEEKEKESGDIYVEGGFVQSAEKKYIPTHYEKQEWSYLSHQTKYFERNVSLLKEYGAEIVFVYAPITKNRYESYTNHEEFYELINAQNGDFINFNGTTIWEDTVHFNDSHHLNADGRLLFNELMIDSLKASGKI